LIEIFNGTNSLKLEVILPGTIVNGVIPESSVECVSVDWQDGEVILLTYKTHKDGIAKIRLTRNDEERMYLSKRSPARAKSVATRERILLNAAELFCVQGYDATSLRGIAKHAHMQAASIYYYFQTKEEILEAVLIRGMAELHDAVDSALRLLPNDALVRERIECAIHAHMTCLADGGAYPETFMRVYLHLPPNVRHSNNPARESYFELWLNLLKAGVANGELAADLDLELAHRFILVVMTRSVEWQEVKEYNLRELSEFFGRMFFQGMDNNVRK